MITINLSVKQKILTHYTTISISKHLMGEQSCVRIGEVCLESQKLHKPLGLTLQYEEKGRVRDGYVASLSQWT